MSTTTDSSNKRNVKCYSAWTKDDEARSRSSSGGVFYEFASKAIADGGIAVGAAFAENGSVCLYSADSEYELYKVMGSKYVQSKTDGIFAIVKNELKTGRKVVFCATPCQCNALLKFLNGKHPDNLLVIDFICHGVPSEYFWKAYLGYHADGKKYSNLSFRDKRISWGDFGTRIAFDDGTEYFMRHQEDPYMRIFLANRVLRPSCYRCRAKGKNRCSDLTLGDFWGLKGKISELGCSVMFVNTPLGEQWFKSIEGQLVAEPLTYEEAVRNNSNYLQSCGIPFNRGSVLKAIWDDSNAVFDHPEQYIQTSFTEKVARKIIRIARNTMDKMGMLKKECYLAKPHSENSDSFEIRATCCGCGGCEAVCQTHAITMKMDEEGFRYPVVDNDKCVHCNLCSQVCAFSGGGNT